MKWIKVLFEKLHVCSFSKPIVSMYVSFNTRDIVYECRCGKCRIERDYRPFDIPFPIETTHFITQKELEKIANENAQNNNINQRFNIYQHPQREFN